MISERFVIPVLVAAAAHAALFVLQLPPAHRASPVEPLRTEPPLPWPLLEPLERPVAEPLTAENSGGGQSVPELPERVVRPDPSHCVIDVPRIVPTVAPAPDGNRIPIEGPRPLAGLRGVGGPGDVVAGEWLDHEPRARVRVPPEYPYDLKRQGLEGDVEVAFVVAADGSVRDAQVVRSTRRELEPAAVKAVLRWRFEPGRYRGRPVAFRMNVPIVFRLDPGP